jgi:hypothetical protein
VSFSGFPGRKSNSLELRPEVPRCSGKQIQSGQSKQVIQETFSSHSRNELPVPIFESTRCEESPTATNSEAFEEKPTSNRLFFLFLMVSGLISIAVSRIPAFQLFQVSSDDRHQPDICQETIETFPSCHDFGFGIGKSKLSQD